MNDSCSLEQQNHSCTLHPGDWAFVDTSHPFQISSRGTQNENLSLRLERPSNPELLTIISQGAAIRCQGTEGPSRILQAMVREIFSQISCLSRVGETGLQRALAEMVWTALRDQFEAPAHLAHQDLQRARVKRFIDSRLDDPDLSLGRSLKAAACPSEVSTAHSQPIPPVRFRNISGSAAWTAARPTSGIRRKCIGRLPTSVFLGASTARPISVVCSRSSSGSHHAITG